MRAVCEGCLSIKNTEWTEKQWRTVYEIQSKEEIQSKRSAHSQTSNALKMLAKYLASVLRISDKF